MIIPSEDRFRRKQAAVRVNRPDASKLYEQIASHIRSRFTTTTREHKLLTKEVRYGFYGFPMEIDTVYGEHRRIAGLFDMTVIPHASPVPTKSSVGKCGLRSMG